MIGVLLHICIGGKRIILSQPERVFYFVTHPEPPPDNNAAERALRGLVTNRKTTSGNRTEAGEVAALDAYCPHLGAHMGYGGRVEGGTLRCPFHGFEFDKTGECVGTPYGTLPSPKCIVPSWPVHEVNGFILAYHHPDGESPAWRVPDLSSEGYGRMRTRIIVPIQ